MQLNIRQYRILFDKAVEGLELPNTFKPYSLRRGGATEHFKQWANMSLTMEIGRWKDVRTARAYINGSLMELTSSQHLDTEEIHLAAGAFSAILARYAD